MRRPLLLRLSLMFTLILIVSITFFAFSLHNYLRRTVTSNYDDLARTTTKTISGSLARHVKEQNYGFLTQKVEELVMNTEEILYIVLGNERYGGLHVGKGGTWTHHFPETTPSGWLPDGMTSLLESRCQNEFLETPHRYVSIEILYESIPEGKLQIGYSLEPEQTTLRPMLAGIMFTSMVTLLLGFIISIFLSRHLTKPIKSLRAFALEIASGNLEARVEQPQPDEIGDLQAAMNEMVVRLDASRKDRERAQKQENDLREKDILLREIHHRVKNNMQILSSLLRMQSRSLPDEHLAAALHESETRIRSMALIHEKLYQSEKLSGVPLQAYLDTLCSELLRVYCKGRRIEMEVEAGDISLELDTALPCGLIVNELVSNALKYAFPEESGYILIELSRVGEQLHLTIHDNGVGLPENLDLDKATSLGLKLVRMLVAQLDGTLEMNPTYGTRFDIRFHEARYEKRI